MEFTVAEQGIPEPDRGLRHSRILRKKKMKITTLLTIIPKNHLDDVTSPMLGGRQWENCWAPTHCTILQRGRTCITMQYFHIKVQICLQNCKGLGAVSKDSFLQQAIPLESSRHPPSPLTLGMCNNLAFSWIELDPNPGLGDICRVLEARELCSDCLSILSSSVSLQNWQKERPICQRGNCAEMKAR